MLQAIEALTVSAGCFNRFSAVSRYGGRKIGAASNIVFSNGLLDPWHGTGVLQNVSDSVVAIIIPEGAHHLDVSSSMSLSLIKSSVACLTSEVIQSQPC